jgi:hypothetical protein
LIYGVWSMLSITMTVDLHNLEINMVGAIRITNMMVLYYYKANQFSFAKLLYNLIPGARTSINMYGYYITIKRIHTHTRIYGTRQN